jgi:hypothetical protein
MDSAQNVFRLLTGGAAFDKKKFSKDIQLFEVRLQHQVF